MTLGRRAAFILVFSLIVLQTTVADPLRPPSSRRNVHLSSIETTDAEWTATDYEIRHVANSEEGETQVVTRLTDNAVDDLSPVIACDSVTGDSWVVWWRDESVDQVLVRRRHQPTGTWSPERVVSSAGETSRNPSVTFDGTQAWIAYEFPLSEHVGIGVKVIEDDPAPFLERTLITSSAAEGTRDVVVQSSGGRVWVSWVHDATRVGWSRLHLGTWTTPGYESYSADSVAQARARIREAVMAE